MTCEHLRAPQALLRVPMTTLLSDTIIEADVKSMTYMHSKHRAEPVLMRSNFNVISPFEVISELFYDWQSELIPFTENFGEWEDRTPDLLDVASMVLPLN